MYSTIKKINLPVLFTAFNLCTICALKAIMNKVDMAHTFVNNFINHLLIAVTGKVSSLAGKFNLYPLSLQGSNVSFIILVKSEITNDSGRFKHLKSGNFFDARPYIKITFISSGGFNNIRT